MQMFAVRPARQNKTWHTVMLTNSPIDWVSLVDAACAADAEATARSLGWCCTVETKLDLTSLPAPSAAVICPQRIFSLTQLNFLMQVQLRVRSACWVLHCQSKVTRIVIISKTHAVTRSQDESLMQAQLNCLSHKNSAGVYCSANKLHVTLREIVYWDSLRFTACPQSRIWNAKLDAYLHAIFQQTTT